MRKKIIAGNWKMNLSFAEAMALADNLLDENKEIEDVQVILASPYIFLHPLINRVQSNPNFSIAAQNCSEKVKGAFTGEIAASMLASIGIEHVILGHSERRQFYGDTHSVITAKVDRALENGICPIFCCGEMLTERNSNEHFNVVKKQLEDSLFHLSIQQINDCIIAYEPVWAIGTGVTATVDQAQEMHAFIRKTISDKYSKSTSEEISILYGGSVTPANASELFDGEDIDGGLVGGASLKEEDFSMIIKAMISKL